MAFSKIEPKAPRVKVFSCYKDIPSDLAPIVLTIGNFDAVHSGHHAVLKSAKEIVKKVNGNLCVLTFTTHPIEVLKPETFLPKLCTKEHKLKLLEEQEVDLVIFFEFTKTFSQQTAEEFLSSLHDCISFNALVLGHDALIGKDRQGDSLTMHQIAHRLSFLLTYVPPYQIEGALVSSSAIRKAIQQGDLHWAEKMLGRKFSIVSKVESSSPKDMALIDVSSLCLPPEGIYPVKVISDHAEMFAEAIIRKEFPFMELKFAASYVLNSDQILEIIFDSKGETLHY